MSIARMVATCSLEAPRSDPYLAKSPRVLRPLARHLLARGASVVDVPFHIGQLRTNSGAGHLLGAVRGWCGGVALAIECVAGAFFNLILLVVRGNVAAWRR